MALPLFLHGPARAGAHRSYGDLPNGPAIGAELRFTPGTREACSDMIIMQRVYNSLMFAVVWDVHFSIIFSHCSCLSFSVVISIPCQF